jgi:hypothetical protein
VAPYLNDLTFLVAHVDLAKVDTNALIEQAAKFVPADKETLGRTGKAAADLTAAFKQAGARDIFVIANLDDAPQLPPFVLVPFDRNSDVDALRDLLCAPPKVADPNAPPPVQGLHFPACEKLDGVLFGGAPEVLARVKSMQATPRPELAQALVAVGDAGIQIAVIPSADSRRVAEQMLPKLPPELGGAPISVITQGMLWASLGITSPKVGMKLVVQSRDEAAAEKLHNFVTGLLLAVVKHPVVRKAVPNIYDITKALTPAVEKDRLVLSLDTGSDKVVKLADLLRPALSASRASAGRMQSMNNLKQISLAMHIYHDQNNSFPPAASRDKAGKKLLSWRVLVLPYLEQQELFKQFHLDEPWDSDHNRKLIEKMPALYVAPQLSKADRTNGKTTYLGVAGPTGMFGQAEGLKLRDITDGTSNTLMIVDVNDQNAVVWTKPDDWVPDEKKLLDALIGHYPEGFLAAFADGSVRLLMKNTDVNTLKALISYKGGEVVPPN